MKQLTLLIISIAPFYLSGQSNDIGVKGGLNISTLGQPDNGFKPKLGFQGGIYYTKQISDNFFTTIELNYSLQGARNEFDSEQRTNYHYLTIPLLWQTMVREKFSFDIGPQINYLIRAVAKDPIGDQTITSQVRNFDIGFAIGLSYSWLVDFSFRYTGGFVNPSKGSPQSAIKFKNKVFQLTLSKSIFTFNNKEEE